MSCSRCVQSACSISADFKRGLASTCYCITASALTCLVCWGFEQARIIFHVVIHDWWTCEMLSKNFEWIRCCPIHFVRDCERLFLEWCSISLVVAVVTQHLDLDWRGKRRWMSHFNLYVENARKRDKFFNSRYRVFLRKVLHRYEEKLKMTWQKYENLLLVQGQYVVYFYINFVIQIMIL